MRTILKAIRFQAVGVLAIFSLMSNSVLAEENIQAAIDLVKEAKAYTESVGKEQALQEFSKKDGKFTRGELYVYAYDFKGNVMAHGAKPELVGRNLIDAKDPGGLEIIRELTRKAEAGSGILEYQWENPEKQKVMTKLGYVEKVDETYWIGSGVYK